MSSPGVALNTRMADPEPVRPDYWPAFQRWQNLQQQHERQPTLLEQHEWLCAEHLKLFAADPSEHNATMYRQVWHDLQRQVVTARMLCEQANQAYRRYQALRQPHRAAQPLSDRCHGQCQLPGDPMSPSDPADRDADPAPPEHKNSG